LNTQIVRPPLSLGLYSGYELLTGSVLKGKSLSSSLDIPKILAAYT